MVRNTYCVIPLDTRSHPFFDGVFKDGLRISHKGKLLPLGFSSVLAHSPRAVQYISDALLQAVHTGHESVLVVASPTGTDAESPAPSENDVQYSFPDAHDEVCADCSLYKGCCGRTSTVRASPTHHSGAAALDLYRYVIDAVQKATSICGEAHLTMVTAFVNSRVMLDELGVKRIVRVEDAVTQRIMHGDENSAQICQHVLHRLSDRHAIAQNVCSLTNLTACMTTVRMLLSKGVIHIVDIGSDERVLRTLSHMWSAPQSYTRDQTCSPRSSWSALCQKMCLPDSARERVVHVVAIPDPLAAPQGTVRTLRFVASLHDPRRWDLRRSQSTMWEHGDCARTQTNINDVCLPRAAAPSHRSIRVAAKLPVDLKMMHPSSYLHKHEPTRRAIDDEDDVGVCMDNVCEAEVASSVKLQCYAPLNANTRGTHIDKLLDIYSSEVQAEDGPKAFTASGDTVEQGVDALQSAILAELTVIEQQLLCERAARVTAQQQVASLQSRLREAHIADCTIAYDMAANKFNQPPQDVGRGHGKMDSLPLSCAQHERKSPRNVVDSERITHKRATCDNSDSDCVKHGVCGLQEQEQDRESIKDELHEQHRSTLQQRHADRTDKTAQVKLSRREKYSNEAVRTADRFYTRKSSSSSSLCSIGGDDAGRNDKAYSSVFTYTWPLMQPIDAHDHKSSTVQQTRSGVHCDKDACVHSDRSHTAHTPSGVSCSHLVSSSQDRWCSVTAQRNAHVDESVPTRVQREREGAKGTRVKKTTQSFLNLTDSLPETACAPSLLAHLPDIVRVPPRSVVANDNDVPAIDNNIHHTTHTRQPTPCDVMHIISALQRGCRKLQARLESIPREMHHAFASGMITEHICSIAALQNTLSDVAARSFVQHPRDDEAVRSIAYSATAANVDVIAMILRFESERCACVEAFVPVFAQLAVAVDHMFMRLNLLHSS